ncbi:MAG TPA: HIT family protein [Blastocatellia bacterium]|nr:HIT family protein [Blastocatellia bacterium]
MAASTRDCAFCRIINGSEPTLTVFEDDLTVAFLDRRPVFHGHCLLVPRIHYETLTDLPADTLRPFFGNAQLLTRAVEEAMQAEGTFVAINNRVSQSVPHLHLHVVPRRKKDGLKGFFWPRHPYESNEAATAVQRAVRDAVTRLQFEE